MFLLENPAYQKQAKKVYKANIIIFKGYFLDKKNEKAKKKPIVNPTTKET